MNRFESEIVKDQSKETYCSDPKRIFNGPQRNGSQKDPQRVGPETDLGRILNRTDLKRILNGSERGVSGVTEFSNGSCRGVP